MPSPVGHGLAGLAVHVLSARDRGEAVSAPRAAVIVAAALLPDLDLMLRFVDGRNQHGNEAHSIGFAVLAGLAVALAARLAEGARPAALGAAAGVAWLTHVVLDYLNLDTHPPIGIMALWPFRPGHYKFPWPIFLDIGRTLEWETVRHNTLAVAWEAAVLVPVVVAVWRMRFHRET